ncbi:protein Fe65 homolog isoform X2 [Gordionus sp. m RMFG-2023]|uniref:protein Fe65 homolog isoform X2 n=1 Tax=Gordionus sp. m RMFG-2023 TaxID=3053472 RepID=UPI0031FBDE85
MGAKSNNADQLLDSQPSQNLPNNTSLLSTNKLQDHLKTFGSPDSIDSGINMETCNSCIPYLQTFKNDSGDIIKSIYNQNLENNTKNLVDSNHNSDISIETENNINFVPSYNSYSNIQDKECIKDNIIERINVKEILSNNISLIEMNNSIHQDMKSNEIQTILPEGWKRHEDIDGLYYWHIKSGTIQREMPSTSCHTSSLSPVTSDLNPFRQDLTDPTEGSVEINFNAFKNKLARHSLNLTDYFPHRDFAKYQAVPVPALSTPLVFHVKSLGWCEINEADLTPERSSKAVNKCIMDLSYGRNSLETIGKWGEGQSLLLEIDSYNLSLKARSGKLITIQPIHSIKVWGVGKENGKDFAYVVKGMVHSPFSNAGSSLDSPLDSITRDRSLNEISTVRGYSGRCPHRILPHTAPSYLCYVFRCEPSAYSIAGTLKRACKRLMIERSSSLIRSPYQVGTISSFSEAYTGGLNKSLSFSGDGPIYPGGFRRPQNLSLTLPRVSQISPIDVGFLDPMNCFPTPIEEPFRVIKALYIGEIKVSKPSGVEVLNEAIETLYNNVPRSSWTSVCVKISPSCITILKQDSPPGAEPLTSCRVRYLSFLGIAQADACNCGFIMSTLLPPHPSSHDLTRGDHDIDYVTQVPEDDITDEVVSGAYLCQVLRCEPTAAALCKTIEAACRLRYQKCLDSARHRLTYTGSSTSPLTSSTATFAGLSEGWIGLEGDNGGSTLGVKSCYYRLALPTFYTLSSPNKRRACLLQAPFVPLHLA